MNWREKLADWISGGKVTEAHNAARISFDIADVLNDECDHYAKALRSIARNTCCEGCQEAARVAKEALGEQ